MKLCIDAGHGGHDCGAVGLAIIADGVEAKQSQVCSAPRPKGPPGTCPDCKIALKLTYTQE